MTTSLLPTFLTTTLHAGPAALGAIEGVSDALVGLSKLAGGPLATKPSRRARLAAGGYLVTALATGAVALATAVWQVAVLRALAWMSRGLRSPARDALLMSLVPPRAFGRASGVERAGDNLGALLGPLIASVTVAWLGIRPTLFLAMIPGLFAALAIARAAREARGIADPEGRTRLSFNFAELRRAGIWRTLAPAIPFELGNVATTLIILRATGLLQDGGHSLQSATSIAILLYAGHNAAAAVASPLAGVLCDRRTPRAVLAGGATCYVLAYGGLAQAGLGVPGLLACFLLAGVGIGLAETAESTLVARRLPDHLRGTGFGLLGLVQSFGDLGASLVAGLIWAWVSPSAAFLYVTAWMALSILFDITIKEKP